VSTRGKNRSRSDRATLDQYGTPEWVARALVSLLPVENHHVALEPHAGLGGFVAVLREKCAWVVGLDVDPVAKGLAKASEAHLLDFLDCPLSTFSELGVDWVVGNPPFDQAQLHVERALRASSQHVAFLLPLAFMESKGRVAFWEKHPARHVWVLASRLDFVRFGQSEYTLGCQQSLFGLADADADADVEDGGSGMNTPLAFYWWDKSWRGRTTVDPCVMLTP